jgi:hypothetical protein
MMICCYKTQMINTRSYEECFRKKMFFIRQKSRLPVVEFQQKNNMDEVYELNVQLKIQITCKTNEQIC